MVLQTKVNIDTPPFLIRHSDKIQMYGSCFVSNIGRYLQQLHLRVDVNPTGIVYNPLSVVASIRRIARGEQLHADQLFNHRDLYHAFSHHSSFSHPELDVALTTMNERITCSRSNLHEADVLVVTFGTAYAYFDKSSGDVVANCHKLPDSTFTRKLLTVSEIVEAWQELSQEVALPQKVLFTVSPIRHIRDGFHQNQLSKSTLLLAIDELVRQSAHYSYFPAYEIMMDELRDYRFYATDMLHPTDQAVEYIWQRFADTYFEPSAHAAIADFEQLRRNIEHRPLFPTSESYKQHLLRTLDKLVALQLNYPYCNLDNDIFALKHLLENFS